VPVPVPASEVPVGCDFVKRLTKTHSTTCVWNTAALRYVCPLPSKAAAVLPAQAVYVVTGPVATNVTLGNESALVGLGAAVVNGSITVAGDGVALCSVATTQRIVVTGASAQRLVIDKVVVDDEVGVVIKGASPRLNSIDVTGLSIAGLDGPTVLLAAAHAQAQRRVTVPCPSNNTVILQPYIANANISAGPSCRVIDLSRLLDVFGRPYEARRAPLSRGRAAALRPRLRALSARSRALRALRALSRALAAAARPRRGRGAGIVLQLGRRRSRGGRRARDAGQDRGGGGRAARDHCNGQLERGVAACQGEASLALIKTPPGPRRRAPRRRAS
jgi:hypothetical protein